MVSAVRTARASSWCLSLKELWIQDGIGGREGEELDDGFLVGLVVRLEKTCGWSWRRRPWTPIVGGADIGERKRCQRKRGVELRPRDPAALDIAGEPDSK